jgi:hypothetical protein
MSEFLLNLGQHLQSPQLQYWAVSNGYSLRQLQQQLRHLHQQYGLRALQRRLQLVQGHH